MNIQISAVPGNRTDHCRPFLQVPKIAHNPVSVTGLCNDGHAVSVTKISCVIKIKWNIVSVGRRTDVIYADDLKNVGEKHAHPALKKDVSDSDILHANAGLR